MTTELPYYLDEPEPVAQISQKYIELIEGLEGDNARLRGLIKAKEWERLDECPWCYSFEGDGHTTTCKAFTPDGRVR